MKLGTIKRLVRRAKIVCSTEESLTDEIDYIKKTNQTKKKNNAVKWLPWKINNKINQADIVI